MEKKKEFERLILFSSLIYDFRIRYTYIYMHTYTPPAALSNARFPSSHGQVENRPAGHYIVYIL
jgi:hypothetical protein